MTRELHPANISFTEAGAKARDTKQPFVIATVGQLEIGVTQDEFVKMSLQDEVIEEPGKWVPTSDIKPSIRVFLQESLCMQQHGARE